ncbi:MAG: TolC family protein [Ignavibacteriae bacterium]|nr:MAG: TolC family protein [Ignavibacteriota bacterium]
MQFILMSREGVVTTMKGCLHVVFIMSLIQPAVSQQQTDRDSSLAGILGGMQGTSLTLAQAVQYGLTNATSVRKFEAKVLAAGGSVKKESGAFDPQLFFSLNHTDQQQPTASFFSGAPVLFTQETNVQTGLQIVLPIGTQLQLALDTRSISTNSTLAFLNPEYDAVGTLSIRQPLLGGFAASARKRLTQSEQQLESAKDRYDQASLSVKTDVELRYWNLYASERDYAVQKLTRDRAEEFLKETQLRAQTGLIGPNQVANAKTFLAEQELLLIEREEQFEQQSEQLAALIGIRPESVPPRFIPVDEPAEDFPQAPEELLVEHALSRNLDLLAAQKDIESAKTFANAARWEALPRVDLVGSLGGNGLAGTGNTVVIFNDTLPVARTASWSNALNQVGKRDYPNWSLGVDVNIPLGLRSGLGEQDRTEAVVRELEQNYIEQSRLIQQHVRTTYLELSNGKKRLQFARQDVEAADEQVRIGMIEFHNGRSTAFELVRLREDLAVAQQRYSSALIRTARAAAILKQLTSGWYPQ